MQLAGHPALALRLLDWIEVRFLRPESGFRTSASLNTVDTVLALYSGYIDGWIAIAAHRVRRFDLSFPIWNRLRDFRNPGCEGFTPRSRCRGSGRRGQNF